MDLGLSGKIALATGSYRVTEAGIAKPLAEEGATVFVHGFEKGQADPVVEQARAGRVEVRINNHGVAECGRWLDSSTDDWVSIHHENVLSGVRLVRAFVPGMRDRGWGRVVWLAADCALA